MRTLSSLMSMAVLLAAASAAQAQQVDCKTVEFNDELMQKFPRLRDACLDVIDRDGQLMAVFKADLLRVQGNRVRIRPRLPDGGQGDPQTVQVSPERRVLIDGKPYRVSELAVGQQLTIYAKVDAPEVALAPAEETEAVAFVPIETEPMRMAAAEAEMPKTASELPALGLLGAVLAALAIALEFVRRVRKLRSLMPDCVAGPIDQAAVSATPSSRIPHSRGESR